MALMKFFLLNLQILSRSQVTCLFDSDYYLLETVCSFDCCNTSSPSYPSASLELWARIFCSFYFFISNPLKLMFLGILFQALFCLILTVLQNDVITFIALITICVLMIAIFLSPAKICLLSSRSLYSTHTQHLFSDVTQAPQTESRTFLSNCSSPVLPLNKYHHPFPGSPSHTSLIVFFFFFCSIIYIK